MDFASDYARALFTLELDEAEIRRGVPADRRRWLDQLRELDLRRVLFAHDLLSWDRELVEGSEPGGERRDCSSQPAQG
jgi:hypothetical protein